MAQDQNKTVQDFVFDLIENSSNLTPDNQNCILAFYRKANKDFLELLKDLKLIPDNYNNLLKSKEETNFYDTEYIEFKRKQDVTMFDRVYYIKTQFDKIKDNMSNIYAAAQNYKNIFDILNETHQNIGSNLKALVKCYMNAPDIQLNNDNEYYNKIVNKYIFTDNTFEIKKKELLVDSQNHIGVSEGKMTTLLDELTNLRNSIKSLALFDLKPFKTFKEKYTECQKFAQECKELYSGSLKVIIRIRGGKTEGELNVYVPNDNDNSVDVQIKIPNEDEAYADWIKNSEPCGKTIESNFKIIQASEVTKKMFNAIVDLTDKEKGEPFAKFVFGETPPQEFISSADPKSKIAINTLIRKNDDILYSPKLENKDINELFENNIKKQLDNSLERGWNMVIFGYGFSGSGKTYTLLGKQLNETDFLTRNKRRLEAKSAVDKLKSFRSNSSRQEALKESFKTNIISGDDRIISILNGDIAKIEADDKLIIKTYFEEIGLIEYLTKRETFNSNTNNDITDQLITLRKEIDSLSKDKVFSKFDMKFINIFLLNDNIPTCVIVTKLFLTKLDPDISFIVKKPPKGE